MFASDSLKVEAIATEIFRQGDDLRSFLREHLQGRNLEGKVLAITSKVVSLAEGRVLPSQGVCKEELIHNEADGFWQESVYGCHLSIKEGLLIPSAGIDESNSESGGYILYPKDPFVSAKKIHRRLCEELSLQKLGVIVTDSHTTPLRRGVLGVALSYYGFRGVVSHVGDKDLFGRELKFTNINVADALAVSATLMMGEGAEGCPLALIDYPVDFVELSSNDEVKIPVEEDLYKPILQGVIRKNGSGSR